MTIFKSLRNMLAGTAACLSVLAVSAQCPAGKLSVTISVKTDLYPDETYWELVPSGKPCGTNTILSGGNATQVGCNGGGAQTSTTGNGYPDPTTTYTSNAVCLDSDVTYTIRSIDSYGDGGATFTVNIDGYPVYSFKETATGTPFNFKVKLPLDYDMSVTSVMLPLYIASGNITVKGEIFSFGMNTITSMNLNYQVDNGPVVTKTLTGLSIAAFTSYSFTHPDVWTPSTKTSYQVKVWADNLNGNADMNTGNDATIKMVVVGDGIPNILDAAYKNTTPTFRVIANASSNVASPTDLDFHPVLSDNQLWVTNKSTEALGGTTVTIYNAGRAGQKSFLMKDGNSWHFMSLPTGIAFSENGNFGTSPGVMDANHSGGTYTGPSLWTSDTSIYAKPSGGNGSHLDMLHESPMAMGIAAESENAFWVYDGYHQRISRFDFGKDHGPGNDDHSDGKVKRYQDFLIKRLNDNIPNHMVLDKASNWLYCVDNGNHRVVRLKINTGSVTGTFVPMESIAETSVITGATWEELITGLDKPCGIDLVGDRLLVGDYGSGDIIVYDLSATPISEAFRIHTNPGLMGIKVGPEGLIWCVNNTTSQVLKLESGAAGMDELQAISGVAVYPNPAKNLAHITYVLNSKVSTEISITDMQGRIVETIHPASQAGSNIVTINLEEKQYTKGMYIVRIGAGANTQHKKLYVH